MNSNKVAIIEQPKYYYFQTLESKKKPSKKKSHHKGESLHYTLGAMRTEQTYEECPDDELLKADVKDW